MSYDELLQKISEAFATAPRPADDALVAHECEECANLQDALRGQSPEELSDAWVQKSFDQLPFMSDDAKRFYLPAYLRVAARAPDSTVAQFVLFALTSDHRWQPVGGYTSPQRLAVSDFLAYIEPMSDTLQKEDIAKARERWKPVI